MNARGGSWPERSHSRLSHPHRLAIGLLTPLVVALAVLLLPLVLRLDLPEYGRIAGAAVAGLLVAAVVHRRLREPWRRLAADVERRLPSNGPERVAGAAADELAALQNSFRELAAGTDQIGELKADRAHLLAILTSMSDGVLVVDRAGKAVIVNPRWRALFGLPEDMEGATPIELTRQTRLEQLITRTLETGIGDQEEIELTLPQSKTIIATSSALSDRSGAVIVARDITDFLRLAEIRRDFVANVSHELKTPLSAIRGLAETLDDGALDDGPAAQHFVGRILRQCRRLESLLSDLLTLSRLERPKSGIERESVDLGEVLEESVEVLASAARQREISLQVSAASGCHVQGDRDALERLTLNLLENAIKYNRPGGEVSAKVEPRGDQLLLEVRDTGIGIPSDSLERLFERFYRVDKGRSREEGGTGLGLAIVKHATQLHGGRVDVESRLGVGSTFSVFLPLS